MAASVPTGYDSAGPGTTLSHMEPEFSPYGLTHVDADLDPLNCDIYIFQLFDGGFPNQSTAVFVMQMDC